MEARSLLQLPFLLADNQAAKEGLGKTHISFKDLPNIILFKKGMGSAEVTQERYVFNVFPAAVSSWRLGEETSIKGNKQIKSCASYCRQRLQGQMKFNHHITRADSVHLFSSGFSCPPIIVTATIVV